MKKEQSWQRELVWRQRVLILVFLDVLSIIVSYFLALWIRFDCIIRKIPEDYIKIYWHSLPYWILVTLAIFYIFRLYHSIWRFVSVSELWRIVKAYFVLIPVYLLGCLIMEMDISCSYYVMGYIFSFICTVGIRFSYRFLRHIYHSYGQKMEHRVYEKVMIIGAGRAGHSLIREIVGSEHLNGQVCCIIDDNPTKRGRYLEGVPIVGGRYDIPEIVEKYHITRIIYAIPTTNGKNKKEILNIAKETGCKLQTIPGIYQLVNGEVSISTLRNVEIQDLLGREQVRVNNTEILKYVQDKVVMVTGGGGSIGNELCRQLASAKPKQLIIFDIYENNAYDIQNELKRKYPELNLVTLIGSVRNTNRVNSVLGKYHPEMIYHAAAHKHVPLMEDSPNETIKNNVFGTYKMAQAATKYGVKRFLLISTDKAVNPTNIMGASKRLCEMVVQMMSRKSDTEFVAVRFGNVLGSNGSVIPLFKRQIQEGGPVTVTDKNIIRLDMGEPVRIDDMARNLIKLSGYEPDVDIKIEYTGLRPGEKLYEELLMAEEGMQETANELIHIGKPIKMDDVEFEKDLKDLNEASKREDEGIKNIVAKIVPTYHPQ